MYVCLCHGVTEQHIRESTYTLEELGVGLRCGLCLDAAKKIMEERHGQRLGEAAAR